MILINLPQAQTGFSLGLVYSVDFMSNVLHTVDLPVPDVLLFSLAFSAFLIKSFRYLFFKWRENGRS